MVVLPKQITKIVRRRAGAAVGEVVQEAPDFWRTELARAAFSVELDERAHARSLSIHLIGQHERRLPGAGG
jgi:hypothetical protein